MSPDFPERVAAAIAEAQRTFNGPATARPSAYRGVDVVRRNPAAPLKRAPRTNSWRSLFFRGVQS